MKKTAIFSLVIASVLMSCRSEKGQPGYTFMDDMYSSPALRTHEAAANTPQGTSALLPVEGTIPRGHVTYDLANSTEGYESSKTNSHVPANFADMDPAEGKVLYNIFCASCHGAKGDGEGILVQREKILGIPGYDEVRLPEITPGSIYHVIMHGKNNMGSHASQLTYSERWKIISYVMQLRANQSPSA
ncbi:MAG: c-type cytochrome [Flavobacteriales bacterium]|jgi:mono/diheme cytochrome c family protein|nr:cytochrome c [Schleiferiaceae bacterium]|tara:strand:+ start:1823 stop:2386 length:564 start_codon:yes stop_codon:yes gene_type:complete